jgi:prevent-host-death family protein
MSVMTATDARRDLFTLVAQVNEDVDTVTITSKKGNAVLVSEGEWAAIKETLLVGAQPGYSHVPAALERLRRGDMSGLTEQKLVDPDAIR